MGGSSAWEYDAHSRTWQPMPALDGYARFTRAVVDRRSGNVILHVGREQGWPEIDPQTRSVVRSFDRDPYGRFIDGPAVFHQRAGILYTILGGGAQARLRSEERPVGNGCVSTCR